MKLQTRNICFGAALWLASSMLQASESFPAAEIEAARDAIQAGELSAAITRLENMQADAEVWEQHFWLGTAYLLDGQLNHAADALDRALAHQGNSAAVWVQRAVVEQEQGRYPVALQFLEVASQVDQDYAMTYLNAGQAYESMGKWDNARSAYGQFLKLSSQGGSSARMLRLRREVLERVVATDAASR